MRLKWSVSSICLKLIFCHIVQNAFADSNSTGNLTQAKTGGFARKMSCANDDACPREQWCIDGVCGDCESSGDCNWRHFCNWNNMCTFGCESLDDCPGEEVCANGKCAECSWNSDCNSGFVCVSGCARSKKRNLLDVDGTLTVTHGRCRTS